MGSQRTSKELSVSIDASVLFTAAHSATGAGRELLLLGLRGQIRLHVSTYALKEAERNLATSAPQALPMFQTLSAALASTIVDPPAVLVLEVAEKVEPKDAPIVAGAIEAQVRFIATYDRKHLLRQKDRIKVEFDLDVVEPGAVLKLWRDG